MKNLYAKTVIHIVVLIFVSTTVFTANSWALNWVYQDDPSTDASGGWKYEVYRMGYAFDEDFLYFNMLTGMPQGGRQERGATINVGDLYINVGGSHFDGYNGTGYDARYASGNVFGLALTDHERDMNTDMTGSHGAYASGHNDDQYPWTLVEQGHLYSDAIFSTGVYSGYNGAKGNKDGGKDPFGSENNAPVHIAEFGARLGYQEEVTWQEYGNDTYEVNALIRLDDLGMHTGEKFELWWSMECGNDFAMIAGTAPKTVTSTPEPGTVLLLGSGLLAILGIARKRCSQV